MTQEVGAGRPHRPPAPARPVAVPERARGPLLPLVLALAACSPGQEPHRVPAPQTVVPGTAGRECYYVNESDATPAFSHLARPAARGNVALWGRGLGPADSAELSIRWAEDGRLLWAETIRSTLPPERLAPLEAVLLAAVRDTAPPDWGVRVRVVGGDVAGTAPSVICPASPRQFGGHMVVSLDDRTLAGLVRLRGRRFPVAIRIDERGNVLDVKLLRRSGISSVDQYLLEYVWRSSFSPKLHDGIGIVSTLEIDLTIPRRWR